MNVAPLLILFLLGKSSRGAAQPAWPGAQHPPPSKARKPQPRRAKAAAKPAAHAARKPRPAAQPAAHAAHAARHAPAERRAEQHAEPAPSRRSITTANVPVAPGWKMGPAHEREPEHAVTTHAPAPTKPVQRAEPEPATDSSVTPATYSVSSVQAILRGLGWTGNNTTQGPVQLVLRDGLYGPVTAGDWQRSANKRGLDPTINRLGPETVYVDPDTYDALRALAKDRGAVVGGARRVYIP